MSHPLYEVVTGEGLMRPCFKAETGDFSLFDNTSVEKAIFSFYLNVCLAQEVYTQEEVLRW